MKKFGFPKSAKSELIETLGGKGLRTPNVGVFRKLT
jgi:hypothetical protein